MEERKDAVRVKGIKKVYKLYDKASDRFREAFSVKNRGFHADHYALDGIDFSVKNGECMGIIGTNGSGKSTLLKIITGVLHPSEGEVEINGRVSALLELGAGFNMEYTGIENVYLNGTMMGLSKKEIDQRLPLIEDFAEIGAFIHQPVKTYSSGMFARLAFAAAINVDPDILIVDEALSVGDIFFQAKCYRKFNEFKSQGKTIIFVSHDMSSVLKYCERCLLIHKGKQTALGRSAEVIDIYKKILVNLYDENQEDQKCAVENASQRGGRISGKDTADSLWKERLIQNPNFTDYGDGRAEIVDFAILDENGECTSSIRKGTECTIKIKVCFHAQIKEPILAYTVKDLKGTEITGTNTALEKKSIGNVKPGDMITVSFCQKMALQGAQYLVSFGCTGYEAGNFTVYHRLYDMAQLQIISDRNTIGCVDLNADVKITYEQA
ncbi:MAG: ABC transporter ATP-binding protein [Eubacterium sp.]|nr:ABC transporter ATP-binding protein [Eubacterium sp.]